MPPDSPGHVLVQRVSLRAKNFQFGLCDWPAALTAVQEAQTTVGAAHADELVAEEASVWNYAAQPQRALDLLATITPRTASSRVAAAIVGAHALATSGRTVEAIETAAAGFVEHCALAEPMALAHPGTHIVNQAFALVEAGRFGEADELARAGYDITVADNNPFAQMWFALMLGKSCTQQGRINEARRWFSEAASTARLHGFSGPERIARSGLASAEAVLGNAAAAAVAAARFTELPEFAFLLFDQPIGPAWAAWATGDRERARAILVTNASAAATLHNVGAAAWLWHDAARLGTRDVASHLVALTDRSDSPVVAARANHVRAVEADDAGALAAAAEALQDLGMMLVAAEAAAAAADAYRRDGDQRLATYWTNRSGTLADRCPGAQTPGLSSDHVVVPLSEREHEVASLAAQGLASQDIADRLFLSIRTVNNHLGNAYAKLGVNRRDQLTKALDQLGRAVDTADRTRNA